MHTPTHPYPADIAATVAAEDRQAAQAYRPATDCNRFELMVANAELRERVARLEGALDAIERMSTGTTVGRIVRAALLRSAMAAALAGEATQPRSAA